jgi:RNA polymerase sigma factor (sigma-70 family)
LALGFVNFPMDQFGGNILSDFTSGGCVISVMQTKSDAQLLGEYAKQRSEQAFAEIVARHTDLVYSVACRQTGSSDLAHEVAQMVFTDLARKASTLPRAVLLTGWLYEAARFAAANAIRGERRRLVREQKALAMQDPAHESTPGWEQLCPVLDDAMGDLCAADRNAILLRYFKNQDFQTVGLALGVSDTAAQRRVSRAVEHLRKFFAKRGVAAGASGLVVVIAANAVQAAPAGLAGTLSTAATATATAITAKAIAMTVTKKVLLTAVLAAVVGTGIYEARQASKPAAFEVRLVLDSAAPDSEQLSFTQQRADGGETAVERLHVQKKQLLDRSALKSAAVQTNAVSGTSEIQVTFTEAGAKRFAEATRDHVGQRLAILIDGKVYAVPKVMMEITGGKAVISGSFSGQEASDLAARLSARATSNKL